MGSKARFQLFPCVGSLRERRARGDHVQQVLPLPSVHGGRRLVACQAGVDVGHSHSCRHATETRVRLRRTLSAADVEGKGKKSKYD